MSKQNPIWAVPEMNNDELAMAIDQAHYLCQHTAPGAGLDGIREHRDELLKIQRLRAKQMEYRANEG